MIDILYQDATLVQFYDYDNPWLESFDVIASWINETDAVLDIGCGTGTLISHIGQKCKTAYGLDLSSEMLAVARRKSKMVNWLQADASKFSIDQKFDFIFLSGHSFQTLLSEKAYIAMFERISTHLVAGGKLVFDSRNPLVEEWKTWTPSNSVRYFQYPDLGIIKAWNDYKTLGAIICYQTYYQVLHTDKIWQADSKISFPSFEQISLLLAQSGLVLKNVYGDWQLNNFESNNEEMIFVCTV